MDRRLLLAIGLMLIVALLPSILWPPDPPVTPPAGSADDSAAAPVVQGAPAETVFVQPPAPVATPTPGAEGPPPPATDSMPGRMIVVESDLYRFEFSTRGARLVGATLRKYRALTPGEEQAAQLIPPESRFLAYRFATSDDTLDLATWEFEPDRDTIRVGPEGTELRWTGSRNGRAVTLTYRFDPAHYLFEVEGVIADAAPGLLTVGLGPRLRSIDGDTAADIQAYGIVTKARSTERVNYRSLDPLERRDLAGPFEWVAIKSKYFVGGVFTLGDAQPRFGGAVAVGGPRNGRYATDAYTEASLPVPAGRFAHSVYVGPQEFRRLQRIGHGFDDVNPYGWILRPVIRPFVNVLILPVLLWMHESLTLSYGWVLVVFGILVRILLWPLNQKAMRSSTAMQAIQPELKAIQDKYKQEPQKLQQEMMKLYREHGVNPLGGCLPMLLPMPILFALFFVFANTIEFRGVSFMWLPDLSRPDPIYIIPLLMGASMFAVTKLGQRGVPPTPQMKMMTYIMPPLFTFLFLNFSSGLNLYYMVSNVASIPQQWLISNERIKRFGDRRKEKG